MSHQAANSTPVQDISGYTVFSAGDAGAAHVMAHRMLDENQIELGHQMLGQWLEGRTGSGSDWVHLQFHMAVFELAVNDWAGAYKRFMNEILPAAATTELALTDAPAMLWRLVLTAPEPAEFPWEVLWNTALTRMRRPSEPFVELHNLLALAGAGDFVSIERWLETRPTQAQTRRDHLVKQMALALCAMVTGAYKDAAIVMRRTVPQLSEVGGSRAQNELFKQMEEYCWSMVDDAAMGRHNAIAA